jgi:tricorn protease
MSVYVRYPSVCHEYIAFVMGQSVWKIHTQGTQCARITSAFPQLGIPALDSKGVAWSSNGQVHIQWDHQLEQEQLTHSTSPVTLLGWHQDRLVVRSGAHHPFSVGELFFLCPYSKVLEALNCGEASGISWSPQGARVIQRGGYRYGAWQRYQGGTAGQLWVDIKGEGNFVLLYQDYKHNFVNPVATETRIFFLSDLSGWGNVHSVRWDGTDLRQHTHHTDFYAMNLTGHHGKLAYTVGGTLHCFDIKEDTSCAIPIPLTHTELEDTYRECEPASYYREAEIAPNGKHLALITRGRLFQLTPHKGPVWHLPYGQENHAHYRCIQWLSHQTFIVVADQGIKDVLQHFESVSEPAKQYTWQDFSGLDHDWGRIVAMHAHLEKKRLVLSNHRHELFWLDLKTMTGEWIEEWRDAAEAVKERILGMDWSPCGRWIAYGMPHRTHASSIILYDTQEKERHVVVEDVFENLSPVFDTKGKYLFFLSARHVESHYDPLHFGSQFEAPLLPFVMTLAQDTPSIFYAALEEQESDSDTEAKENDTAANADDDQQTVQDNDRETKKEKNKEKPNTPDVHIDFEGIQQRIQAFPVEPRAYTSICMVEGAVFYSAVEEEQKLWRYSLTDLNEELFLDPVQDWSVSADQKWMTYMTQGKLRVIRAGAKPDDTPDTSFRAGGWLDWQRIPLRICPRKEWRQMFDEAWRLQRDLFWREDWGGIDWQAVYTRYRPLVERISHIDDLWAVIEEMHGELGTSHAYVMANKHLSCGQKSATLGAELIYDSQQDAYRIERFSAPGSWQSGPLQRPGLGIQEGDYIFSIGGQKLSKHHSPAQRLWGRAGLGEAMEVGSSFDTRRSVVVFPALGKKDEEWRYESWILNNARYVHEKSQGQLGYIHIPDMGCEGMNIFMRSYLQEFDRKGLVIDARFNGGGNVSEIIFRYLTQRRIGYDQSRWSGLTPYPRLSPRGPMVLLINAYTGSDGDMFAYAFKHWNMGTVIGKRTWGGVVGISPKYPLLDGSYTTQPEYAIWFPEAGWSVENTGVSPDLEVECTPQDQANGRDPQLDTAIEETLKAVAQDAQRQHNLLPVR